MCPVHIFNKNERSFERLRLATMRLKTFIFIQGQEEPLSGFGFVADFSETGLGIYVPEKLALSTLLQIAFESANATPMRGRVVWCNRFLLEQNFFGQKTTCYRAGIKFIFASEAERQRYMAYMVEVRERARLVKPGMVF